MGRGGGHAREYRVWHPDEEESLRAGVKKHGLGAWEKIRTDPEFSTLVNRSGVQLKDKWRNLVKFRHITPDETQQLQPKTSGPWHTKYTKGGRASGSGSTRSGRARKQRRFSDDDDEEEEEEEEELEVMVKMEELEGEEAAARRTSDDGGGEPAPAPTRKSARASASSHRELIEAELGLDEERDEAWDESAARSGGGGGGGGGGASAGVRKKRRAAAVGPGEDRRYGIYDRRRYGESGSNGGGGGAMSGGSGGARGGGGGGGGRSSRRQSEDMGAEGADDAAHPARGGLALDARGLQHTQPQPPPPPPPPPPPEPQQPHHHQHRRLLPPPPGPGELQPHPHAPLAAAPVAAHTGQHHDSGEGSDRTEFEEGYVVECPCGIQYDDGNMMIECEGCQAWAHTDCLLAQMTSNPTRYHFNFQRYLCYNCQHWQRVAASLQAFPGGAPPGASWVVAAPPPPRPHSGVYSRSIGSGTGTGAPGARDPALLLPLGGGCGGGEGVAPVEPCSAGASSQDDGAAEPWQALPHAARPLRALPDGFDSQEDGMVDIDPVLLLILQGSLYVNKKQRTTHSRKSVDGWSRGAAELEPLLPHPPASKTPPGAEGAGASGRHHPSAIVPGHPKWSHLTAGEANGNGVDGGAVPHAAAAAAAAALRGAALREQQQRQGAAGGDASDGIVGLAPLHKPLRRTGPGRSAATGAAASPPPPLLPVSVAAGAPVALAAAVAAAAAAERRPSPPDAVPSGGAPPRTAAGDAGRAAARAVVVRRVSARKSSHRPAGGESAGGGELQPGPGGAGASWAVDQHSAQPESKVQRWLGDAADNDIDTASRAAMDRLLSSAAPMHGGAGAGVATARAADPLGPHPHPLTCLSGWGLGSGTPPPGAIAGRGGAGAQRGACNPRAGDPPPDATPALHMGDVRPPTPDVFALFSAPTPEVIASAAAASGLADLAAGGWPGARTPPLPEAVVALGQGLTYAVAGERAPPGAEADVAAVSAAAVSAAAAAVSAAGSLLDLAVGVASASASAEGQHLGGPGVRESAQEAATKAFFDLDGFASAAVAQQQQQQVSPPPATGSEKVPPRLLS